MSDRWQDEYRSGVNDAVVEGKWTFWKIFWPILGMVIFLSVIGYALGWFGEAAQVAQKEFGATAALAKYEWFIDQEARIEKMDADIAIFEGRVRSVDKQYEAYGSDRSKWAPDVRVQYNSASQQARDDLVAIASQRNNLAREYTAAAEKFNWAPFQTRVDKPRESFQEYKLPF